MKTTTTHTPGPWHTGDSEWHSILGPKTRRYNDDGRLRLVNVCTVATSDDEAEDLANARLIAQAPELLACLSLCLAAVKDAYYEADAKVLIERTQVAIAKATGENAK